MTPLHKCWVWHWFFQKMFNGVCMFVWISLLWALSLAWLLITKTGRAQIRLHFLVRERGTMHCHFLCIHSRHSIAGILKCTLIWCKPHVPPLLLDNVRKCCSKYSHAEIDWYLLSGVCSACVKQELNLTGPLSGFIHRSKHTSAPCCKNTHAPFWVKISTVKVLVSNWTRLDET